MSRPLEARVAALEARGVFLGGPRKLFEEAGRKTLMALLALGLRPDSRVLDIGCGCLRGGYWLISLLGPGRYFGIEPNVAMWQAGLDEMIDQELRVARRPRFDHNDSFDFGVFAEKFDFFVARSIWTHATKAQIARMMDGVIDHGANGARFLTSFLPATLTSRDYRGDVWVGKSHRSSDGGVVHHSFKWIRREGDRRGLQVCRLREPVLNFGSQEWLVLTKGQE